MYINGQTGAVQGRVGIYKRPPHPLLVRAPWECAALRTSAHCVLRTQWNTNCCTGPLCEVPIM
ncbi:unnamed protein product [Staurois parvus]|uniref:Uncharacterized protein n=1 Tax=Staurois parvus TaxID=386267 RepID=A0ABN9EEF4_9NEOB|nr:unnamed protein product [Staurois parvus]